MKQLNQLFIQRVAMSRFLSRLFMLVLSIFTLQGAMAQTTLNTTAIPGWLNNNGSGTVTFNFQNTNAYPVIITGVEGVVGTAGLTSADVWVKTTPISGPPGVLTNANGWFQMATGTFTGVASGTSLVTQPFLTGISVTIPAGVTYGIAIAAYSGTTGRQRYFTIPAGMLPTITLSGGGCNIIMGTLISYATGAPPTAPSITPRGWIGKLTFVPAAVCTDPPTPGTPAASATGICVGQSSILSLTGGTGGTGQTYQWEESATSGGPYTNVGVSSGTSSLTVTPTATTYYRCQVTCGATTAPSTEVSVAVNPVFPGGSYTINSALPTGGSNFQSFTDAVSAISCGIAGPVVFDVDAASGPYTEQITLPATIGSDATKTVTFNGNGRTIQFASADANNRHVIKLNGADYITFNDLQIVADAGTYGWGIHFINGADYNNVNFCTITASITSTTSSDFQPVVMSNSVTAVTTQGNNGNYNTFIDNTFIGGYYGITMIGNGAGAESNNNTLTSNTFRDFYSYCVYLLYQKSAVISTCDISRPNRTASTTTAAVFMTTGNLGTLIENNRVHNFFDLMPTSTSIMYTFYDAADATAILPNQIINNVVYNMTHNGTLYGSYNTGGDYLNVYHNTFAFDHDSATAGITYGLFQTTAATGINYRNNMITITRGGTGIKVGLNFATATSTIVSNNNVVYLNSAGSGVQSYGSFGGTTYATLALWQTANGGIYDANSRQANPFYASPLTGDFTPTSALTNNVGSFIGIGNDINGFTRSVTTPDAGAYEYDLFGLDASIAWVSPTSPTTPGLQTITVSITNLLSDPITDLVLSYTDGGTPVTETFSGLSITSGLSQTFSFAVQYNLTAFTQMIAYVNSVNGIADDVQLDDTTNIQNICFSLAGAYTIDPLAAASGTNFQSFTSFANALNCGGVSGPVTVDVASGGLPYTEQISINAIAGSSAINTVTINGNNNMLTFPSGAAYYTLRMNGADNMIWNNLQIATTGTANGIALNMTNASDNNTFTNCTFTVPIAATSSTTSCVAFSSSTTSATTTGNNGSNNTFSGCTMSGGYYCVSVHGISTGNISGNQFLNCNIKEYYTYGFYQTYSSFTVVRECIIERPTRTNTTTCYGIALSTGSSGCLIERNRVRELFGGTGTTTGTCYGLYCIIAATAGNENRFINNVVSDIEFNGALYGIYFSGATYVKAYHNTVSLDHVGCTGTAATYGIYCTGATSVDIQDNIVTISRGGTGTKYCAYYSTVPTTTNYNDFFINSAAGVNYVAYDGVTNFATMAAYQLPTRDAQSVSINPNYTSPILYDYKPTEATLDNLGFNVGVSVDITGATRGAVPDMGAYDYTVFPVDLSVTSFVGPGTSGCYSAAEDIVVTIKNNGALPVDFGVTPATVTLDVTGAVTTTLTANPAGTLASGASMNVTLTPLNMTTNGTYLFNIYTTIASDGNTGNDALTPAVSRIVGPVGGTVTSTSPSLCVTGTPSLSLSGHYGGAIQWQESNVSPSGPFTNVGTGTSTYTPAAAITTTTYYQAEISCNGNTATSNTYTVTVNNPSLTTTTPGTRCGYGSVALGAVAAGAGVPTWYAAASGGTALATGNTFNTPNISSTTDFYVSSAEGGGGGTNVTPMPALGSPFSGNVRGYWFTAPSDFTITGLQVPLTGTTQSMAVIKFVPAVGPPSYSTVTNAFTTLYLTQNNANTGVLPVNIPITAGEVIGIFGQIGTQSAYAATTGVVNTTINGQTVALTRMGMQFPLGTTAPQDVWQELTAAIGVVNITYTTGCESSRVAVTATVTPSPTMTVTATDLTVCPGGSTSLSVSSPNDPDYTYSWTSDPAGFTASGAGPHTVSPTVTTKYYVLAQDMTAGPNAGCGHLDSVTIITGAVFSAGTVSSTLTTICVSATPTLSVSGLSGGSIQWQDSSSLTGGLWVNVGTGTTSYTPASPVTTTTYYRVQASCQANTIYSNTVTVTVNSPQITSSTPGTRCGYGPVVLDATPEPGATLKWFTTPTGGSPLFTGAPFTTPPIAATTTFYAEASTGGGGGGASPLAVTEVDLGGTDQLEIQNVSPDPLNVTGWKVAVSNSYTDITSVNTIVKVLSGTLNPGDRLTWSDAAANANYWGNNLFWNPGAFPSFTGWVAILDDNNVLKDFVIWNWPSANIAAASITVGATVITVGTQWTGDGINATTVAATQSLSRQGTSDNNNLSDWTIQNTSMNVTNPGMTLPFTGFGCQGIRVPVVATVTPSPAMTITATATTVCAGESTTLSVTSPNDPDYTYTWNPGNLSGSSVSVTPATSTTYTLTAIDNTAGAFAGCGNVATIAVTVNPVLVDVIPSVSSSSVCEGATVTLAANESAALGYSLNPSCSTTFVDISATGTDVDLPANIQDDTEHNIAIPSFTFNGVTYTSARVSMNGMVALGSVTGEVVAGNGPLPTTANTAGSILLSPFWDDLYPIAGVASVKTETIGSTFIIQWTNATHFDDSISGNITFQIQLDLTSGVITYVYNDVTFGNPLMDAGISATVGIQMSAASALQYSTGTASLTAGQCISFTPHTVSVSWAGPNSFTSASANPVLSSVTLLESGTYTVTATGNNGCAKTATVNLTVNAPTASTTTISTCTVPYVWNGNSYTNTGIYTFTAVNAAGCDSTATLDLTITTCNSILNLTCFIEGYWDGTSGMISPLNAQSVPGLPALACDSADVELRDMNAPYGVVYSVRTLLNTDGTATCVFPAVSGSYYIAVKNRTSVQTWSASPVLFAGSPVSYNFTTSESQAYGAGGFPTAMKEVATGVWAFYSGDVVADENVDLLDLGLQETDISDFAFGYEYLITNVNYPGVIGTDINGDGNVDLLDSPILENNISNFIFSNHP